MDIELVYDKGLLREIGGVAISYGQREWMDTTPRALGSWPLEYQQYSATLRAVGDVEITYRRWSSLPRTVGHWDCEHGKSRLERVGPYQLRHDRAGSHLHRRTGPDLLRSRRLAPRWCAAAEHRRVAVGRAASRAVSRAVLAEAGVGRVLPSPPLMSAPVPPEMNPATTKKAATMKTSGRRPRSAEI